MYSVRLPRFSLNAGQEIFHVAFGTYSRFVPQTPEKIAGQIAGQTAFEGSEVLFSLGNGAPGATPTRDLPLRRRIYEPFCF